MTQSPWPGRDEKRRHGTLGFHSPYTWPFSLTVYMEMHNSATQVSALKRFAEDNTDLERLEEMLARFDAFAFQGVSGSEKIHSDILAWLLDPGGTHSAGGLFLTRFLLETGEATGEQIRTIDWSNTIVQREWRNVVDGATGFLDILILNAGAKFACAIENKVFSGEHSEQLTGYRRALEDTYFAYRRSHLFLSRQGTSPERPEERKFWKPVDYGTILRLVEKALDDGVGDGDEEVMAFLRQYATTLRRRILPNIEIKQMASRIYLQHREAIDLINSHKEAYIDDLREICQKVMRCQEGWELIGEHGGKKLLGFIHTWWKESRLFRTGTGWQPQTDSLLVLDFDFRVIGQVTLILTMSSGNIEDDVRKKLYDKTRGQHPGIFDHRGSPNGGYQANFIRLYASGPILMQSDIINGDRASWGCRVMEWVSEFMKNEYPEMNRTIRDSFREIEAELGHRKAW